MYGHVPSMSHARRLTDRDPIQYLRRAFTAAARSRHDKSCRAVSVNDELSRFEGLILGCFARHQEDALYDSGSHGAVADGSRSYNADNALTHERLPFEAEDVAPGSKRQRRQQLTTPGDLYVKSNGPQDAFAASPHFVTGSAEPSGDTRALTAATQATYHSYQSRDNGTARAMDDPVVAATSNGHSQFAAGVSQAPLASDTGFEDVAGGAARWLQPGSHRPDDLPDHVPPYHLPDVNGGGWTTYPTAAHPHPELPWSQQYANG